MTLRAFRVECPRISPTAPIVFAATAGQASYAALQAAREAGYYGVNFADFRVRRAPEYDGALLGDSDPEARVAYAEDGLTLPGGAS